MSLRSYYTPWFAVELNPSVEPALLPVEGEEDLVEEDNSYYNTSWEMVEGEEVVKGRRKRRGEVGQQ